MKNLAPRMFLPTGREQRRLPVEMRIGTNSYGDLIGWCIDQYRYDACPSREIGK